MGGREVWSRFFIFICRFVAGIAGGNAMVSISGILYLLISLFLISIMLLTFNLNVSERLDWYMRGLSS